MSCLTLSLRELKRPQPPLQVKSVSSSNDMCKMFMASKDLFCQSIEGHHTKKLMEQVVDWMQINQFQYKSNSSNKNTNNNLNGSNESISGLPTNTSLALVIKGYGYKRSMGPSLVAKINDIHKLGKYLVSCQVAGMDHEILLIKPDLSLCITTGDTIELFVKTKIIKTINGKSMDLYLNWKIIR
ncbi:uncharacterized protein KQ657_001775 [Scheffersomyces spartinae]|uniref:Uncharacterized protein n=1 Tax=Scheffersomyces spartinae TaxID=45513 RepID=A0A9P7V712_9ASCO|nr:uncharacterized protein KQ657_001775 [Scheffersomyces spartinae]KAG7192376.1 hypothetical protein KQ657_001775 [Scheffersomyces spartinae]